VFPGYTVEVREEIVIITSPSGETIGGPGKIAVVDVAEKLKKSDMLTPAAAALLALGTLPQTVTLVINPHGEIIAKI